MPDSMTLHEVADHLRRQRERDRAGLELVRAVDTLRRSFPAGSPEGRRVHAAVARAHEAARVVLGE